MKSQETRLLKSAGKEGKQMYAVDAFSPEEAQRYAERLFKMRVEGWGDETRALDECALLSRMTPIGFKRLMSGKTKEITLGVFGRVRKAYLDYCARKAAELLNIIEEEKAVNGNVRVGNLDSELESLVARIEAARAIKIKDRVERRV